MGRVTKTEAGSGPARAALTYKGILFTTGDINGVWYKGKHKGKYKGNTKQMFTHGNYYTSRGESLHPRGPRLYYSIAGHRPVSPELRLLRAASPRRVPRTPKLLSARNPPKPTGPKLSLSSNTSAKRNPSKKGGFPGSRKKSRVYFSV